MKNTVYTKKFKLRHKMPAETDRYSSYLFKTMCDDKSRFWFPALQNISDSLEGQIRRSVCLAFPPQDAFCFGPWDGTTYFSPLPALGAFLTKCLFKHMVRVSFQYLLEWIIHEAAFWYLFKRIILGPGNLVLKTCCSVRFLQWGSVKHECNTARSCSCSQPWHYTSAAICHRHQHGVTQMVPIELLSLFLPSFKSSGAVHTLLQHPFLVCCNPLSHIDSWGSFFSVICN